MRRVWQGARARTTSKGAGRDSGAHLRRCLAFSRVAQGTAPVVP